MKLQDIQLNENDRFGFNALNPTQQKLAASLLQAYMDGPWQWNSEDKDELVGHEDAEADDVFSAYIDQSKNEVHEIFSKLDDSQVPALWAKVSQEVSEVAFDAVNVAKSL